MIAHASVPRNPPAAPITFSTSVRDAWCVKHYRAIGRPKADNRSRYTRIDPSIFAVFTVCRANAVWKFVACGLQRCSNSLRGYVKRKRSTGIFVGSFIRRKEERANREKGTSIRNGVSFVHGEIRAKRRMRRRGGRLCRDIVISFRVISLGQSRRSDGNIDARRRNYIVKRMQSYVGRDPNAAAGRQEVECPRTTYGLALGTNVIVCLVNISWSAEKRDDTCSKTVSVLLLPANDGAAMGKRTLADLFRCKF